MSREELHDFIYIRDADQKVMDFFPDYAVKKGEKRVCWNNRHVQTRNI